MNTQRIAGMIGLLAAVTLGVVGIDRLTKDAKARQTITPMQVASNEPRPATAPSGPTSTIHFQVAPTDEPLPPIVIPKESAAPPLLSTGEFEKKFKESIEKLEGVLPKVPSGEESAVLPPAPTALPKLPDPPGAAAPADKRVDLPSVPPIADNKDPGTPPLPSLPVIGSRADEKTPVKESTFGTQPKVVSQPAPDEAPKPLNPSVSAPPLAERNFDVPSKDNPNKASSIVDSAPIRNVAANISSSEDFQKRLSELEMKYLKDMVAELAGRMRDMPQGEERRKVEMDHTRHSERLMRMIKAAETLARRTDDLAGVSTDSPWTMHVETVGGKTVLQAIVHRKARFKVTCDRLDLQTPRGTLLAVGQVQIAGEGFQGACERLSIPLHDDRLILEGNAQVGVRTQPMALISDSKDGLPPLVSEPRRQDETGSSTVPILHLKGEHLDLRWNDLATAPGSAKNDDLQAPTIRGSAGPMVKVAYNSPARDEKWSAWGTLLAMPVEKNEPRQYVIQTREGQILAFVRPPANMSMNDYIGKRVSVFGIPSREEGRAVPTFSVSHVAWE